MSSAMYLKTMYEVVSLIKPIWHESEFITKQE